MKSLLLGSAATFVVVAGAQAADLPTKKGAPAAEYVRVCKIGDIAGFVIPGTDTCLKIGGLITAQTTFGSTADQYVIQTPVAAVAYVPGTATTPPLLPVAGVARNRLGVAQYATQRDQVGMYTRGRLALDAVSNTAYGPLLAHINIEENVGTGFDSAASYGTIDGAYLQWAGITAGYHTSFFQFIGGGVAWDDLLSAKADPTEQMAYTATFGGGFSATLSIEAPQVEAGQQAITESTAEPVYGPVFAGTKLGIQSPDIVGALDVTQGWGSAHLGGLLHQIHQSFAGVTTPWGTSVSGTASDTNQWGWGVLGGVSFNLPSLGAGADIKLQGQYTDGAIYYTHLFNIGAFNFSGTSYDGATSDAYYNAVDGSWVRPTAWGVAAVVDLPIGPTFKVSPEISYGEIKLSTSNDHLFGEYSSLSPDVKMWVGGATFEWDPVHNLAFDLDLLYGAGTQSAPTNWGCWGHSSGPSCHGTAGVDYSAWKSDFDGFNGKLRITRSF